jgi:hypothetical protein
LKRGLAYMGQPPKKLVQEPIFNPLEEDVDTSEFEYELEDASDDESLEGHNKEWLLASKSSRKGDSFPSSIDVTRPLPRLIYKDIPILFQGPEEAEKINRYFVIKR